MATVTSKWAAGLRPMPNVEGAELVNVLVSLPVTAAQTAANDIYYMCDLPEDAVLVDAVYAATDLDTAGSPAMLIDFGVLNADASDIATSLQAGLTVGQAGTAARLTPTRTTMTVATTGSAPKKLGYKVATAAGTGAAGTVYLSLTYRSSTFGA
jgi:hypothetical protein